jgi:UDPglucose 6-dehydrogenase
VLAVTAARAGTSVKLVETAISINDARKRKLAERVRRALGSELAGKSVAVLGVTFKANTDDVRDSPAIDLVNELQSSGADVRIFDPQGKDQADALLGGVAWCSDPLDAAKGADVVVIVTEWHQFKPEHLDLRALRTAMAGTTLVDFRNLFDPKDVARAGLAYHSLGRRPALPETV